MKTRIDLWETKESIYERLGHIYLFLKIINKTLVYLFLKKKNHFFLFIGELGRLFLEKVKEHFEQVKV